MEKKAKHKGSGPVEPDEISEATTPSEKTVDEMIQDMLEENRLDQIETNKYAEEVAKRLWTRTR